jgi:hypothetical protein
VKIFSVTTHRISQVASVCAVAILALPLASCDTPTGQGAGIGAATGAIIGGLATNRVGGAAAGALAGAAAGALVGAVIQQSDAEAYGPVPPGGYPVATPTSVKGSVISPYAPFHQIDVQGAPHGALVRDPSCNRLFVNP